MAVRMTRPKGTIFLRLSTSNVFSSQVQRRWQGSSEDQDKRLQGKTMEELVSAAEDPEEPTTCCMSGCANCVWIQYAEVMVARHKDGAGGDKARKAIDNIKDPMMKAFLAMELRNLNVDRSK
ncbi:hypothetical protein B566_EDAN008618 [Ephemera danica]|nr:hypothetical protein B566_EDAN008618 [Ephemera danica]